MNGLPDPNVRTASWWVYGALLLLCPVELRREFGAEIRTVFTEDLDDAWKTRGFAGAVGVWWYAACEVIRMAIPGLRANPAIAVTAVLVGLNLLVVGAEVLVYLTYVAPAGDGRLPLASWSAGAVVCGTTILVALTALLVVRAGKARIFSLGLSSGGGGTRFGTES